MHTKHLKDPLVWQKAMELAKAIYGETSAFPKDELFSLRSQLRRTAVSVPSNIAEGHGHLTDNAFRVFLGHARGSLYEAETQIMLSAELGFRSKPAAQKLVNDCNEVGRTLNGLLRSLNQATQPVPKTGTSAHRANR